MELRIQNITYPEESYNQPTDDIEINLTGDLEEQFKKLDESAKDKTDKPLVQVRVHQLAIAKMLVIVHEKPITYLIDSHCKLGEAYLNFKCFEQAIDHLSTAHKKNSKSIPKKAESKKYYAREANIQTLLGKTYLEMNNNEEAIKILQTALNMIQKCYGEEDVHCISILNLLANCYTKIQDYDEAIDYLARVWDISELKYGPKSEGCANVYLETAIIYSQKGDFEKAAEHQKRAISILVEANIEKNPGYIADLYTTLSTYQQKNDDNDGYIASLDKVKKIYAELCGDMDKRTIKTKKKAALALLRTDRKDEALREFFELEQLQANFYGEDSLQLAKTLEIIGALQLFQRNFVDAQKYYSRALNIFEEQGVTSTVADLKKKIKATRDMREKTLAFRFSEK